MLMSTPISTPTVWLATTTMPCKGQPEHPPEVLSVTYTIGLGIPHVDLLAMRSKNKAGNIPWQIPGINYDACSLVLFIESRP